MPTRFKLVIATGLVHPTSLIQFMSFFQHTARSTCEWPPRFVRDVNPPDSPTRSATRQHGN